MTILIIVARGLESLKKVCFVVSHLGSGYSDLLRVLNRNPRCEFYDSGSQYDGPLALEWMFRRGHKCRDNSAVYGDALTLNVQFSSKDLYDPCKFIYLIRPARPSLNVLSSLGMGYAEHSAASYYRFRLRRICEMAKRTPDAVLLSWDDLAKGTAFPIIEQYLGLKDELRTDYEDFMHDEADNFDEKLTRECQDAYERYYYYLSKLKLRRAF